MSPSFTLAGALAVGLLSTQALAQTCLSFGIDFQNGGSYFQNISSSDAFTFASVFEGCQNDVANNILIDPNGDEYQCTDSPLQPDDTTQVSTCPINKNELFSGAWSVVIISNNGDTDPIAYERDFSLDVGLPVTEIYTPTVTATITTTPIMNVTITSTFTDLVTATSTKNIPSSTKTPTRTITPHRVTSTSIKTVGTVKKTKYTVQPTVVVKTVTASCSVPRRQNHADPTCTITPTLVTAAALATSTPGSAKFRHRMDRRVPLDREQRIAERKARLAQAAPLVKRAPDFATTTVTDTNTANWPTTTSTVTAAASTMTITTAATVSSTTTITMTVMSGVSTASLVTVTAATPTTTKTKYTVITKTVATVTRTPTVKITKTWAPASATPICKAKGGKLV